MDLKETGLLNTPTEQNWYYKAKLNALKSAISANASGLILDVGAGSGFFSKELIRLNLMSGAILVDPGYEQETIIEISNKTVSFKKSIQQCDASLVLMMDVLEHVPDPVGLVKEYIGKVPAGTTFIITVPAFQFLWSEHDVFLEHYRRYTLVEIENILREAGLKVSSGYYLYGGLFPLIATVRLIKKLKPISKTPHSDMKPMSNVVNTILSKICCLDGLMEKHNRLCGTTAMVVAIS